MVILILMESPTGTFAAFRLLSILSSVNVNAGVTSGEALSTQLTTDVVVSGSSTTRRLNILTPK
ncbi:hypothetical protein D3C73_1400640 [compost metagenome]